MSMSHYNLIVMSEQKCRALTFCYVAFFSQVAMIYNLEVWKFNFYWLGFARSSNTLLDAVPEASLLQSHAFFSSTGFSSIRSSEAAVASIRETAFPTTAAQQPLQLHIISGGDSQLIRVASSLFSVLTRKIYVHLSPWNRTTWWERNVHVVHTYNLGRDNFQEYWNCVVQFLFLQKIWSMTWSAILHSVGPVLWLPKL